MRMALFFCYGGFLEEKNVCMYVCIFNSLVDYQLCLFGNGSQRLGHNGVCLLVWFLWGKPESEAIPNLQLHLILTANNGGCCFIYCLLCLWARWVLQATSGGVCMLSWQLNWESHSNQFFCFPLFGVKCGSLFFHWRKAQMLLIKFCF